MRSVQGAMERVRYLDASLGEHFYVLQRRPSGWCASLLDRDDNLMTARGPFDTRGAAILAAEAQIDAAIVAGCKPIC